MRIPDVMSAVAANEASRAQVRALPYSRYLLIGEDDAAAWHALGTSLARLGNRVGAFTALRNALLLDGSCAASHIELGKLLFDSG